MKRVLTVFCLIIFMLSLVGCSESESTESGEITPSEGDNYVIDYEDAISFEKALNDGEKVNGKIVQFDVLAYKPDSGLGINCWSGEHLNFISEIELSVQEGDIVVGVIIKEPSKVLGSWKIPYEVIEIKSNVEKEESVAAVQTEMPEAEATPEMESMIDESELEVEPEVVPTPEVVPELEVVPTPEVVPELEAVPTPAVEPIPVTPVPEVSAGSSGTVWLSATGEKYHSYNSCGRMNPSKAIPTSEAEAIAMGKERCSKCW